MIHKNSFDLIVASIQELSLVKELPDLMLIVRKTARKLTNADGVTFVLRDKDLCFYADEDAISPLWKGQRFPASNCISGWVMANKTPATIYDIYMDNRIPFQAYEPTFVKSLAMVPIRSIEPLGAIGCYWSTKYTASDDEIKYLQALADVTSVAFEKIQVYKYLEEKTGNRVVQSHDSADILFSSQRFLSRLERL